MTARQVFEYALIELNKVEAPSLLLEDYNYFINKAVSNYVDKRYNIYDINQQTTDDLRVLKGTATITSLTPYVNNKLQAATYVGQLPSDYYHLLNCVVEYSLTANYKCYTTSEPIYFGAKRLTAGMFSQIINNYYMRPTYKNPYYYIHNNVFPTVVANVDVSGTSSQDLPAGAHEGNASPVNIEIRYGRDNSLFVLNTIFIDYLRVPQWILLTQTQIDTTEDLSATIEFPDYVCQEIIKELVMLLMENASDPRLNTNPPVNQSIAQPGGGQQEQRPAPAQGQQR